MKALRASAAALTAAEEKKANAALAVAPAEAACTLAVRKLAEAEAVAEGADSDLAAAQRSDHAVAAAQGLTRGDPCPVCSRKLPSGFVPPTPSEVVIAAATARTRAQEKLQRAKGAEMRQQHSVEIAEREVGDAAAMASEASSRHDADLVAMRALRRGNLRLDATNDVILADLSHQLRDASSVCEEARKLADAAATKRAECETVVRLAEQAIDTEEKGITRESGELDARTKAAEAARLEIPTAFRPEAIDSGNALGKVLVTLQRRCQELSDMAGERTEMVSAALATRAEITALADQQRRDVDVPAQQALRRLARLADRTGEGARLAGLDAPEALADEGALANVAAQAAELEERAREVIIALGELSTSATAESVAAQAKASTILTEVAVSTAEELQSMLEAAAGEAIRYERAETDALGRIEPAQLLDAAIEPVRQRVRALEDVTVLLRRDGFIKEVCERRQQALLAAASEILLAMTNGRYGFDKKFTVGDTLTGVSRKVDTLSGGETFLASLALALGLVEVARRSGGRLDAIFLDEGFGSLDQSALDNAIVALEAAAIEGRMVAVVTHIRRVVDNIDRILAVTRPPEGSRAVWLQDSERQALVDDDVAAQMIT